MQVNLSAGCALGDVYEAIQVKNSPTNLTDYYIHCVSTGCTTLIKHVVCYHVTT